MGGARGNKGSAGSILGGETAAEAAARLPSRTGMVAGGGLVTGVHELVDPARCRIWSGHNRDHAALSETSCADLLDSLRAQRRQEMPAIVRRVADDPAHEFEVICGARRHWSVTWLRARDLPELRFLVEPRELTDEAAFRLADLENRSRRDLSDYERATDYARAVDRYYEGSQQRMADRLEVSKSWLSRYLELARLDPAIVAAFGDSRTLGISHAARLAPLLRAPRSRLPMLAEAGTIGQEQALRRASGRVPLGAAVVLGRLLDAAELPSRRGARREATVRGRDGVILARGARSRGGPLTISIPTPGTRNRPAVLAAVAEILDRIAGPAEERG